MDDPGFLPPVPPAPPSSSESSIEVPSDGRRKCSSCPRRMSKESADRHTICVQCRGFDCDINSRCDECLDWSEEEISKYAKYRKSLKSRESSSRKTSLPPPPLTPSGHSSQPSPHPAPQPASLPAQQPAPLPAHPPAPPSATRDCLQSQMDSLAAHFTALSESLSTQLSSFMSSFGSQSRQPRLGPDAGEAHPGVTADESRMFQGEGTPSGTPLAPPPGFPPLPPGFSAPHALHGSTPFAALRKSARQAPHVQPPSGSAPQPSTSGWLPPGPLLRIRVTTLRILSLRRVIRSLSPLLLTLLIRGSLPSFTRSALPRALSLTPRLRGAGSSLGSASQSLPPPLGASVCTLALRRYRKRLPLGRRLSLADPGRCRASFPRVRATTRWLTTLSLRPLNR